MNEPTDVDALIRRHLRFGWWSLLVFLTLGIALETMHGFKIGWYLDVSNETRRLMFRLAHAHGGLLGLVHIALAATLPSTGGGVQFASRCLIAASLLLPGGFFLGGVFIHGGDPGLGVLFVPIGGLALLLGVFLVARRVSGERPTGS